MAWRLTPGAPCHVYQSQQLLDDPEVPNVHAAGLSERHDNDRICLRGKNNEKVSICGVSDTIDSRK